MVEISINFESVKRPLYEQIGQLFKNYFLFTDLVVAVEAVVAALAVAAAVVVALAVAAAAAVVALAAAVEVDAQDIRLLANYQFRTRKQFSTSIIFTK